MSIQAKIEFYVRISDARHPELFDWIREASRSTGLSPQDIAIYCMTEQLRRGGSAGMRLDPMPAQRKAPEHVSPGAFRPPAAAAAPQADVPQVADGGAQGQAVPMAPFGGGLLGDLMDRGE